MSTPARRWIFRSLAAVAVPAAMLLFAEGGLRLCGYGQSPHFLIPDAKPGYYRTNPNYLGLYLPRSFDLRPLNFRVPLAKPPHTLRIVVLGESAAEGVPEPAFGFAPQLRALLRARYPGRDVEVINTGIVAINSHVVYQVARDMAQFAPDLFVVYMGNNEVVGPYGPGCAYLSAMPPRWAIRLSLFVRATRVGQLAAAALDAMTTHVPRRADWGGMSMFVHNAVTGDDPRLEGVYGNFDANLRSIVAVAKNCGARTLLCTVVSNLKDCAPLLSQHRAGLSSADLAAWREAFDRGRLEWTLGDETAAGADLRRAFELDPHYADTAFLLGAIALQSGDIASARAYLVRAEHWDALRFRPDPQINTIIREVARASPGSVTLVDAARELGSDLASTASPAGHELLFEHVHFNWDGNYQIARRVAAAAEVALGGTPRGSATWLSSRQCAAALAYSPHEQYSILLHNWSVVQAPPFTHQLTYPEDEARIRCELAAAQAAAVATETRRDAKATVSAALARDPENPTLWKIAEDIDDDLGDTMGALEDIQQAEKYQPANFALFTDEAIKLARLGRYTDAEQLLLHTSRQSPWRDRALMAPAFVDLYTRTNRLADARQLLDRLISRRPADAKLHLLRAQVDRGLRDDGAAEVEYRDILRGDPGNQSALEGLLNLLRETGRSALADREALAAAPRQPTNLENNLRAALLAEHTGDNQGALHHLLAAEHSGPITSAVELRLARKLLDGGQTGDGLLHLGIARHLAAIEGDTDTATQLDQVIATLRPRS